jgi:hypothetical protein
VRARAVAVDLVLDHDRAMTTSSREPYRPILTTDADVTTMWHTLINPLGWHLRRFYLMFVDAGGRPNPQIVEVDEIPEEFGREDADGIVGFLHHILEMFDLGDDGSVALMFARPGQARLTDDDRDLCLHLHAAARAQGLQLQLLHVGTDTAIIPVPMDELLPRSA